MLSVCSILVLFGWCAPEPAPDAAQKGAQNRISFSGRIHVIDGDTFDVSGVRVRLQGVDAPELDQVCETEQGVPFACGQWVVKEIRARFQGQVARCQDLGRDRYDRVLATCDVAGQDVGQVLVSEGWAYAYRQYSMAYDLDEKAAAVNDRGLHAARVQSPAQFRKTRVIGRFPPDRACAIKGNISTTGTRIYHMPGQKNYDRTGIRPEDGERWFCSEAEAKGAGWRAARR